MAPSDLLSLWVALNRAGDITVSLKIKMYGSVAGVAIVAVAVCVMGMVSGCEMITIMTSPIPTVETDGERRLIVFAPGSREGKMKYFDALDRLDIPYEVGLQINAYLPLKEHYPELISPDRINARESFVRAEREWNPKPPIIAYYDYEPNNGKWNWDVQRDGYKATDMRFFDRALAELRGYQRDTGNTLPIGFYGQPVTRKDVAWTAQDRKKIINNKPLLDGFDWIVLSIYSRGTVVNSQTEAQHRERIRSNWAFSQEVFPDRPIIPMVSLKEIQPDDMYGKVYFDEFNRLGISTVAMWVNPDSMEDTDFSIRRLRANADSIRAWMSGDED
jgi:hypothetical protein